jgi:hypothetical protein
MLNFLTGSNVDYGNTNMSKIYDEWQAQCEAWDNTEIPDDWFIPEEYSDPE